MHSIVLAGVTLGHANPPPMFHPIDQNGSIMNVGKHWDLSQLIIIFKYFIDDRGLVWLYGQYSYNQLSNDYRQFNRWTSTEKLSVILVTRI